MHTYRFEDGSIPPTRRMKCRSVAAPDPVLSTLPVMATWCPNKLILVGEQNSHHSLVPRPPLALVCCCIQFYCQQSKTGTREGLGLPEQDFLSSLITFLFTAPKNTSFWLFTVHKNTSFWLFIVDKNTSFWLFTVHKNTSYACMDMHMHATWNACGNQTSAPCTTSQTLGSLLPTIYKHLLLT